MIFAALYLLLTFTDAEKCSSYIAHTAFHVLDLICLAGIYEMIHWRRNAPLSQIVRVQFRKFWEVCVMWRTKVSVWILRAVTVKEVKERSNGKDEFKRKKASRGKRGGKKHRNIPKVHFSQSVEGTELTSVGICCNG